MAVGDSAPMRSNSAASGMLRGSKEHHRADASYVEPQVPNKWRPVATLTFIVLSCGLLWAGILAAVGLI